MKHYSDHFQAWLSGELDEETRALMKDHLAECSRCSRELSEQEMLWNALGDIPAEVPGTSVWPGVQSRTTAHSGDWFFGAGKWTRSGLAASALTAGLVLGIMLPGLEGPGSGEALATDLDESETMWISGTSLAAGETDLEAIWFPSQTEDADDNPEGGE